MVLDKLVCRAVNFLVDLQRTQLNTMPLFFKLILYVISKKHENWVARFYPNLEINVKFLE